MILSHGPQVIYRIDATDEIRYVNDTWIEFAIANSGSPLIDNVVGTPLWRHIAGAEVRHLYVSMLHRVREHGETLTFNYRCDSPASRRDMRMEISPLAKSAIEFRSTIVAESQRPTPLSWLDPSVACNGNNLLRMCAWCKAIRTDQGWLALDEAIDKLQLFFQEQLPEISHGMCPSCFDSLPQNLLADQR